MKITKYLIALGGFCAIIIWAGSTSCSSKDVSCNNDSTFASASSVLVAKCSRCHGDSLSASKFGKGIIFNSSDSNNIRLFTQDPTVDSINYGVIVADIEGKTPLHLMPLGGPKLTDCEVAAVKNWIWHNYTH